MQPKEKMSPMIENYQLWKKFILSNRDLSSSSNPDLQMKIRDKLRKTKESTYIEFTNFTPIWFQIEFKTICSTYFIHRTDLIDK
jgi:hypothetical protein